jgi:hypothetical protein
MGFLVAIVILLIFDLDRPSSGFITNNQQSIIDACASMAAFFRLNATMIGRSRNRRLFLFHP